jgi:uncharacterized protein (DUF2461 family)
MIQLTRSRRQIVDAPRDWTTATAGLDVQGGQLKRVPAGFPASHEHIDDLKRKDLYVLTEFSEADVTADDFLDRYTECCERGAPLVRFQTKALGLRW